MVSRRLIQKAKDTLDRERGAVRKPWGARISVCLIYPNHYSVGMSNLGFQTIYRRFNSEDDVVCERAFLPAAEDLQAYGQARIPLFSLESQKPLFDFDLLAFSISFENDFVNVLTLLDLIRIPLESSARGEKCPLVMAGGVAVFLNPEPLSDFFDFFVMGEGEEVVAELMEAYRKALAEKPKRDKEDLLKRLAKVEGMYVPSAYRVTYGREGKIEARVPQPGFPGEVKRRWVKDLDRYPTRSRLYTPDTEFKGMALVEVNRGCPRGCRFCAACFAYHPFRNRSRPLLEAVAKDVLSDERRVGLAGTAVSDYAELLPLCRSILSDGGRVSLSSMRVDAITPGLAASLKESEVRTATIAPEAGSTRLRKIIKKGYTEEQILDAVHLFGEHGLGQIKCYFMIGLPSETEEDVQAILHLAKKIRHQILSDFKNQKRTWRIILSVNPFIPKPATPFQWVPLEEVGELKRKLRTLEKGLRGERGMEMIHDLPKWAYLQALLSRGDRRVGRMLLAAHHLRGDWGRALRETSLNPDFFVYRRRDLDEIFPWDFIDHGVSKERLKSEYLTAMKEAGVEVKEQ